MSLDLFGKIQEGLEQFTSNFASNLSAGQAKKQVPTQIAKLSQAVRERRLKRGDEGYNVKLLQGSLKNLGYYEGGKIDGIYGPGTERAVKKFQADNNLASTGVTDFSTVQKLHTETKLKAQRSEIIPELVNLATQKGMLELSEEYPDVFRGTQGGQQDQQQSTTPTVTPTQSKDTSWTPWIIGGALIAGGLYASSRSN